MAKIKREFEEILDEEREQVLKRVCAIDVARSSGKCACGCRLLAGGAAAGSG
jgi:hypothetical protein